MTKPVQTIKNIDNKLTKKRLKGLSLFSSAGIAETYYKDINIDIVVANELVERRSKLYQKLYPESKMINGDITKEETNAKIKKELKKHKIDIIIATPPCQGVSLAGKNKSQQAMADDKRNHLIFKIIEYVHLLDPSYVLIENVPRYLQLFLEYENKMVTVKDILEKEFGNKYNIEVEVFDSSDFGVAQKRKRAFIKLFKKNLKWKTPKKEKKIITLKEAIGHLPSLESGEKSNIKWHYSRIHTPTNVLWMKHTPTNKSAFENKVHYPKKENGETIKAFKTTYARMDWDQPAPTITMRNDCIASQRNVHPGRLKEDGTYSDARVLTPLELMILTSLPENWNIPEDTPEILIRQILGECVPPLLIKKVLEPIKENL
ncbi:MAG: DNA cytosine methyltransferase [Candidatus Altimarinota bacterium]